MTKTKGKAKVEEMALVPSNTDAQREAAELAVRNVGPLSLASQPIKTDQDLEERVDFQRRVQTALKLIDKAEKEVTSKLDAAKKLIKGWFNPMREALFEARAQSDQQIIPYLELKEREAERRRAAEFAKAEAERKRLEQRYLKKMEGKGREELQDLKAQLNQKLSEIEEKGEIRAEMVEGPPPTSGRSERKEWDFEVVDLDQVPREWLRVEPNRQAILAWARQKDLVEPTDQRAPRIPGLRFFTRTISVVRGL